MGGGMNMFLWYTLSFISSSILLPQMEIRGVHKGFQLLFSWWISIALFQSGCQHFWRKSWFSFTTFTPVVRASPKQLWLNSSPVIFFFKKTHPSPYIALCVCISLTAGAGPEILICNFFFINNTKGVDRSERGLCEKIIKCFRECQESIAQHCQHSLVLQAIIRWHGGVRDVWQFISAWSPQGKKQRAVSKQDTKKEGAGRLKHTFLCLHWLT